GGALWVSQYFYAIKDQQGKVDRVVILTEDISDRKKAEEALKESERVLSTLMSNLPGMAYRCADDAQRTMEFVSEGCANLTGYQPLYLIKNRKISYGDLIHPDDRKPVAEVINTALSGEKQYKLEYRIITAWGSEKWVWEMGRGVFTENGKLVALEGFVTDVTDRKKAENALKESEELYRSFIETSPDSIALTDLDGNFTLANQRVFALHGIKKVADLMEINFFDLIIPQEMKRARENAAKVLKEGRISNVEYTMLRKDGTSFPAELSASLVVDALGKPKGFIVVTRDITDRKEAEEALDREHKSFRIIAEAAVNAIDIPDLCQRVLNGLAANLAFNYGIIRLFNRAENTLELKALAGLGKKQLKEMILNQPLDDPRYVAAFVARRKEAVLAPDVTEEAILKPFKSRLEHLGIKALVSWPVLGAGGNLLGVLHLWSDKPVDITSRDRFLFERVINMFATVLERKKAEEALRESEEHYRTLVDTAQEGISLVGADEKFIFVNPKMAELMGYPPEELIGRNLLDFVPPDDSGFIERQTRNRQKGESSRYDATLIRSDGNPINVLVTAAPIFDAEGKFYATLGVLTDITELKKAEEELRLRLVYQTAYAQIMNLAIQLEDLEEFIAGCLEILGNAFTASRIYLASDFTDYAEVTQHWRAKRTPSLKSTRFDYTQIQTIGKRLKADELISGNVSAFPSDESRVFKDTGA
ncbi:PAS domain S-box protein, partial [candidate division WOR-3 bacterium]|nr:PAS domain S-box protein [candidate division WOR-3 bacterium]